MWGLKAAIKPQEGSPLSGVAHILDADGPGYCYVKFNWPLVGDMGKVMPRGVAGHEPAYLMAMRMHDDEWVVYCVYVHGGSRRVVWIEHGKPPWVRSIKRKDNAEQVTGETL